MARRRKLHEISLKDDIRYRGPLSYQGFQILGWLCIVLLFEAVLLKIGAKLDKPSAERYTSLSTTLRTISTMSLPFLLVANYAKILDNAEGYKKQLLRNGGAAAGIFLASVILYSRYVVVTIQQFVTDPEQVVPVLTEEFFLFQPNRFVAFNIFIDLFLCTLFMFFLNARPKRVFTGKKVILFRLFAILPVAYEVASIALKGMACSGRVMLPIWTFPLLTVKPPMSFLVFLILALHIKTRERRFCRHGRTHEEYLQFLKTNRNSLHFSIFLAVVMVLAAVADYFLLIFVTAKSAVSAQNPETITTYEQIESFMRIGLAMGFGNSFPLLFVAPFVLLFSYTRNPKNRKLSMLIPVGAIALMVLLLVESVHQGLGIIAARQTEKLSIRELMDVMIQSIMSATG